MTTIKFTEDQILLNKLKASYLKDKDDEKTNFDFFDALAMNSDLEIPNTLEKDKGNRLRRVCLFLSALRVQHFNFLLYKLLWYATT